MSLYFLLVLVNLLENFQFLIPTMLNTNVQLYFSRVEILHFLYQLHHEVPLV